MVSRCLLPVVIRLVFVNIKQRGFLGGHNMDLGIPK